MIKNKQGLSTIVVTLIIILLSLVAVGVVWAVVNNLIKGGTTGVEFGAKCLNTNVEATTMNCSGATTKICTVQLTRTGSETTSIGGVKLVFRNVTTGVNSALIDVPGDIASLVGIKITEDTGVAVADGVNSVDVTPYFTDASGKTQICSQTNTLGL